MKGGKRQGAGRPKGAPNKSTAEIRELAQRFSPQAVNELARLAGLVDGAAGAESEAVRKSALDSLLDRGHGKPSQPVVGGDDDEEPIKLEHAATDEFISRIARISARAPKG